MKLYAKVLAVFDTIQHGLFKPDLPGAASVAAMAQALGEGRPILPAGEASTAKVVSDREGDEVESDDSDQASVDLDAELGLLAESAEREVFRGVPWSDCAVHLVSGITHVKRDSSSLLCGRFLSGNYKPFKPGSLLGENTRVVYNAFEPWRLETLWTPRATRVYEKSSEREALTGVAGMTCCCVLRRVV